MAFPAWVAPGVKCVCINDRWEVVGGLGCPHLHRLPMLNEILTIRETEEIRGLPGLAFEEIPLTQDCLHSHFWLAEAFRPLHTKSQEDDMAIFRPILDRVPEKA